MRESDVIEWLIEEGQSILSSSSLVSLSNTSNHVDAANFHDGHVYPFLAVQQIASTPQTAGIGGGELLVDELAYDRNGVLQSVTYRRDVTLRVSVIPTTDENPNLRDDLADDVVDHFSLLARKSEYPEDVDGLSVDEATPQGRSEDFVAADGVPLEIDYSRYITDENPDVAETVNLDVSVERSGGGFADAFDRSF